MGTIRTLSVARLFRPPGRTVQLLVDHQGAGGRPGGADQGRGLVSQVGELRQRGGMIQSAETKLDGKTLIVRIPMLFQRRGGRKRIVAPDGSELKPTTKPQPDSMLVKARARLELGGGRSCSMPASIPRSARSAMPRTSRRVT